MASIAVNDLIPPDNLACLLCYDTVDGRWRQTVTAHSDALVVGGRKIPVLARRDPAGLPWRDLGVDPVLECTGAFRREEDLKAPGRRGVPGDPVRARAYRDGGDRGARREPGTGGTSKDFRRGRAGAGRQHATSGGSPAR